MGKNIIMFSNKRKESMAYSKKLEWSLRDFISAIDEGYYDDEIESGILALYLKLDNEICVEQKIHIRQNDYICYTILSCCVDSNRKEKIYKCIQIANEINCELDYGNFEVNEKTGEIVFKSIYEPDNLVCVESLDKLIGYPRYIINKYGYKFLEVNNNTSK